ncbi:MAG TPA: hypothetical protein PK878_12290 [bacterium]|nr:hypothetical protein [bacterium]HOL95398.1 hypothetical protein [bacterium]HPO99595.1 hypothetical protein [bacterium]HXK93764.1 hypothetical protein [bacterium]
MTELIPPADPLGIPTPVIVFQFLALLTFVLHLIFMNYILGGMVILTVNEWFFGKNPKAAAANVILAGVMPVALSMAITMGVAPLLFVQVLYGQFFYTANIMMGGFWLLIAGLVIVGFYLIYVLIAQRPEGGTPNLLTKLISLVAMILFFAVAFLYTNNAVLTENPDYWKAIYTGERFAAAPDPTLWPRYLHNVTGALALAGLWCAAIGRYQVVHHPARADAGQWMVKNGLHWAAMATALAMILGGIYLYSLGIDRIKAFMGNGILFVGWSISVMTAILSLVCIAMAMMKPDNAKLLWGSIGLAGVTLAGMVMGRELVRMISLQSYYTPQNLMVRQGDTSLYLFLATFLLGLGVLVYMLRMVWTLPPALPESDAQSEFTNQGSGDANA